MTPGPLAGIAGASGAVGAAVAVAVSELGVRVRLGARGEPALRAAAARCPGPAEVVPLDITEAASLGDFCAGCDVVVNCAATTPGRRAAVAAAALPGGAHYLDPGGDARLLARRPVVPEPAARAAVVAAGVQPGLTELIPRWLAAQEIDQPYTVTAYTATLDRMTPGSATEFLLSLGNGHGDAHAAWRAGARQPGALAPLHDLTLPFFAGDLIGYPYLSAEAEQMARRLGLAEFRCYHVFEAGGHLLAVLSRLQQELRGGAPPDRLAGELAAAAELEMFGRAPSQQLVFQLEGRAQGRPAARVAVLRASSTYQLTASVTTAAVEALLGGRVPAGWHLAADVLDPALVGRLPERPGVAAMHLLDRPLADYAQVEQGRL